MTTPQKVKYKPIVEIRFDSISGYIGQGLGPLLNQKAVRIAKLFALKLSEEHGFSIGRENHLYISYSTELQPGAISVQENKTKTFYRTVHVGFAQSQFQASGGNEVEFTINTIAKVLATIVGTDNEAIASIEVVRVELLKNGEESIVRMLNLYTEGKEFRIEPYLKLSTNILMYLKVIEVKTNRTAETLFLEGTESEIFRLVKSLSIKENKIVAKHAPKDSVKNRLTIMDYLSRGFTLPVEVQLDDLFHP